MNISYRAGLLIAVFALAHQAPALQDDPTYERPPGLPDQPADTEDDSVILQQDQTGTLFGYDRTWRGLKRLERIQFLANIQTIRDSVPLIPCRPVESPIDFSVRHPTPLGRSHVDPLLGSPLEPIMSPIRNIESALADDYGMNFGIYYTMLYQHVSDPVADQPNNFGTGRLDVNLVWNLWEYPVQGHPDQSGDGHGLVGILVRQGNQIGVPNDAFTSEAAGSIQGLNSLYTGQYGGAATLNLLYYQQGIWNDRLVLSVGKVHPNQYIGLNFWANDESRQFLAGPFDGIQTLGPSQGSYQLGVALQMVPTDWMFVNAMVTDALGTPYTTFSTLDEGYYWTAVEAGFVLPPFSDNFTGPSCLSLIWSHQNIDAFSASPRRETSNSFAMQFQGHLSEDLGIWVQGGVADEYMSKIEAEVSCGIGMERPLGREGDLLGVAFNWSKPSSALGPAPGSLGPPTEQTMMEFFYRIQLTGSCQLTPDIQVIFDPGYRSSGSTPVIFGLRLTTDF